MKKSTRRVLGAAVGVLTAGAAALGGTSAAQAAPAHQSAGVVHLTFTNWDGGMQQVVNLWNKKNPKIQVKLIKPSGTGYTLYNKLITNNKAGTNPDVTEVEYQAVPALIANHVIVPLNKYLPNLGKNFPKNVLAQVQFQGKTYGVPQNSCPMVLFYRKDVFDKDGLTAPTTWAEFAADAQKIHAANPSQYIGNFDANDPGWFAGLAQQAGANWWTAKGSTWKVNIDDAPTQKVASYWQGLVDSGDVSPEKSFTPQWNTDMNDGTLLTWTGAQWAPNQFPSIAGSTAGKWAAAPLPAWTAGSKTVGIWGGETESVTANSKHPAQAAKFVNWMNGTKEGLNSLIKNVQVFPAMTSAQSLPALQTPPPFMSNQPGYNKLVAQVSKGIRSFQIWGPNANVTFNAYSDAFGSALQNKTSFSDALTQVQQQSVSDMKKSGYKVAG